MRTAAKALAVHLMYNVCQLAVMKRHFPRFWRFSLCPAVTRVLIAGLFILTSVAFGASQPGIFVTGERGSTFYHSNLSGARHSGLAVGNRWESVFCFCRPSLFGVEFLTSASGFHHSYLSGLPSAEAA